MAAVISRIGYKTLYTTTGVTVTESDEVAGFESENAYDWKQYDWWKQSSTGTSWIKAAFAAGQDADYMAVFGHNLADVGGSVKPQYSDNDVDWSDADTAATPTDGSAIFVSFTSQNAKYWRCLVVTTTGQSIIAGIMIGKAMVLDRGLRSGFKPPTLSPIKKFKTAMSELGVNLGGSVKSAGIKGDIALKDVDPAWVRSDWVALIEHLNVLKPAVFSWDYENNEDEACLMWVTKQISAPRYSSTLYMDVSLAFEGIE